MRSEMQILRFLGGSTVVSKSFLTSSTSDYKLTDMYLTETKFETNHKYLMKTGLKHKVGPLPVSSCSNVTLCQMVFVFSIFLVCLTSSV